MFPLLNGKSFLECEEEDLQKLIDNESYHESEYLEYKRELTLLTAATKEDKKRERAEFRADVCAFANSEGGYLIFGIQEDDGCPHSIVGIDLNEKSTDKFKLNRTDDLNGIQPKLPTVDYKFIRLENGRFVVIMQIKHDNFSPYIFLENEKDYRIYKRYVNGKRVMMYSEIRQMFYQSISLEQAISGYINRRIEHYKDLGKSFGERFIHLAFIPEYFTDANYRKNVFALERKGKVAFSQIFSPISCNSSSIPCVDGIRFVQYPQKYLKGEGYINNNGIVEIYISVDDQIHFDDKYPNGFLPWKMIWERIQEIFEQYRTVFLDVYSGERVFISLSIIGCSGITTESGEAHFLYKGEIDRDIVICDPIEILKLDRDLDSNIAIKKLYISYLLSIGVKHDDELKMLIDEVY